MSAIAVASTLLLVYACVVIVIQFRDLDRLKARIDQLEDELADARAAWLKR